MNNFEATYKENYPRMFRVSQKMIADEDAVNDIVQEVFVSYFQKSQKQNQILNPRSWLMQATINKSIDFLNRKKKHSDLSMIESLQHEDLQNLEKKQKQIILQQALKKLNAKEMKLAVLYSESFSYKEISELTGIKFNSVGKTLSRTLQKLKTILNEMNYEMY